MEGEIPGWDRLELNGNSVSILSTSKSKMSQQKGFSTNSFSPILQTKSCRLESIATFPLNSYFPIFSGRNIISISFYPLSKDPHAVSALRLLEFQSHVFTYCVNLLPSDLSFGTKHPFLLLNLDHTSQPINLGDTPFLELDFQSSCPTSYPMDG